MRLDQISAGNGPLAAVVVSELLAQHPLLPQLEFYSMVGNADSLRKASAAGGGTVRNLNTNYAGVVVDPAFASPTLKIVGDEIKTDQAHERRGQDIASVRAADLKAFARRFARNLVNYAINGTGVSGEPTGLKALTPAAQKFFANTSSAALTIEVGNTDAKKSAFAILSEKLQYGIQMVDGGAGVIIMPAPLVSRVAAILSDSVQWRANEWMVPVPYYNMVPIISAGYTNEGASIIAGDETHGTISGTCYSVYFARFGERTDVTIATNNGLNVTDKGLVGSQYVYNIDFDLEFALENDKAIAKLEGLKLG